MALRHAYDDSFVTQVFLLRVTTSHAISPHLIDARRQIRNYTHYDESRLISEILKANTLTENARQHIVQRSRALVSQCRAIPQVKGTLDSFMQEFGLSNKEGVILMCLAESLLRVPDNTTANRLIAEKISSGDWHSHTEHSDSLFMHAAIWGLMLTGKIVELDLDPTQPHWMKKMMTRISEPVIQKAVYQAMHIMADQYVLGQTIEQGIERAQNINPSSCFSFDMLGEAARTDEQAHEYYNAYVHAIDVIGKQKKPAHDIITANSISVKLSALHPLYDFAHKEQVMAELLPRLLNLCQQAYHYNIGLSIDAEEATRLELSLDIFTQLACAPQLAGWQGLGFVLQTYQKRAPAVADWLITLAHTAHRRLPVRVVKGAYWDSEIKIAQQQGLSDYPVFTRKANSDLCYQHCAMQLLAAQEEIYPQFATHNAYSIAMILQIAEGRSFEFQRLHGMGNTLYGQILKNSADYPLRVYAPIGNHSDLLPYLVRRLLENGANSSFVNRFLDNNTPVEQLLQDNMEQVCAVPTYRHPQIPLPADIFIAEGEVRRNARGMDLNCPHVVAKLQTDMAIFMDTPWRALPIIDGVAVPIEPYLPIANPAQKHKIVGTVGETSPDIIARAVRSAADAQEQWQALGSARRAKLLYAVADEMEAHIAELMTMIVCEAGRTIEDSLSEVREAVDFCRYYAEQITHICPDDTIMRGWGTFLCISPWNFPLAIFTGQIAASLVTGNTVLAKPAEQTPLIAARAVEIFHKAGVPGDVLHLLPGDGRNIGEQLLTDQNVSGVAFTGSTATAQYIYRQLALRITPIPLIAETGGLNCMIVDSTALPEQVVDDVIASAFFSAGQRCSSLRVLFVQSDIADKVLCMLIDAMKTIVVGDPMNLATHVGPVIDCQAHQVLQEHIERMSREAVVLGQTPSTLTDGWFIAPHVFEIQSLAQLPHEVFGPLLHVIRYTTDELDTILQDITKTDYGLTLGVHSRIESFSQYIFQHTAVGNTYINRNMIGAVVGVNPFGGHGLSGTGPKAGGPWYLYGMMTHRYAHQQQGPLVVPLPAKNSQLPTAIDQVKSAYPDMQSSHLDSRIACAHSLMQLIHNHKWTQNCLSLAAIAAEIFSPLTMPGPTGEKNTLSLHPKGIGVLIADDDDTLETIITQLVAALLCGNALIICSAPQHIVHLESLTPMLQQNRLPIHAIQTLPLTELHSALTATEVQFILANSMGRDSHSIRTILAARQGAIVPLWEYPLSTDDRHVLRRYVLGLTREKNLTDNVVARGGNAQLFNLSD